MTKRRMQRKDKSRSREQLDSLVMATRKALPTDEQLAQMNDAELWKIADAIAQKWNDSFHYERSKSEH
jgi:hypothetical protein